MSMIDGSGSTETNRAAGGGLAEIGLMLRRRREEIGHDIAAVSAVTHIKPHYLKAIEDGRRKDLPGTAYMIGYIRTYANHLGFDGNRLITDYHDTLAGHRQWVDKRAEPAEPAGIGVVTSQVSPVILIAGLLVLGVAIFIAWGYATAPDEEPVQTAVVEAPVEPEPPAAEPVIVPAPKPQDQAPTGAAASAPTDRPAAAAPEAGSTPPAEDAVAEDQLPPEAEVASTEKGATDDVAPSEAVAAEPEDPAGKIVIRARLESWVHITDAKEEVIYSRVMRAGETYTVPEEQGLMFTTGNAGGVEILVDGTKLKSLGAVGLVKRNIPLDAKRLKDGSAFQTSRAESGNN